MGEATDSFATSGQPTFDLDLRWLDAIVFSVKTTLGALDEPPPQELAISIIGRHG